MDILLSIDAYPVHVSAEYRLCTMHIWFLLSAGIENADNKMTKTFVVDYSKTCLYQNAHTRN